MRYHKESRVIISPKALRIALAAADIHRPYLAKRLSINPITLFRWANGLNRVAVATVHRMEKILGVPEGFLTNSGWRECNSGISKGEINAISTEEGQGKA